MSGRLSSLLNRSRTDATEALPMPLIVGSPRSGTTLLRLMLDSHPQMAIPPETGFLLLGKELKGEVDLRERFFQSIISYPPDFPGWGDFHIPAEEFRARLMELRSFTVADGFRLFYRMYAARFDKRRWGDKTPLYCRHLKYIQELLPESRFIHIIRDGRDAAVSLRKRWFSPGYNIETQARYWRDNVVASRQQGAQCRYYMEVRYEDLLCHTESTLQSICSFLDLKYHADMLRYYERAPERLQEHQTRYRADGSLVITQEERLRQQAAAQLPPDLSRIGVWQESLSEEECRQFEVVAGELLRELGYSS